MAIINHVLIADNQSKHPASIIKCGNNWFDSCPVSSRCVLEYEPFESCLPN